VRRSSLTVRPATEDDREFAFAVKRAALGPHVARVWGWDDEFQHAFHAADWAVRRPDIVEVDGVAAGTIEVAPHPAGLELGEFYLLPAYQRQGIGSELLRRVLDRADDEGRPVRLQFLKANPVRSLYERHGFRVVGESATHYRAERPPARAPARDG
jgi:ribosomal protein S18 acetylase RimI-like enzyme